MSNSAKYLSSTAILLILGLAMYMHFGSQSESSRIMEPEEWTDFFEHDVAEQIDLMKKMSLDRQYAIYRYGVNKIHPPLLYLANPIASRGKVARDFLYERLTAEPSQTEILDISHLAATMYRKGFYDFRHDLEFLGALEHRAEYMHTKGLHKVALSFLGEIKGERE